MLNPETPRQASRRRFVSNVLGPHFEQVCREWTLHHADADLVGGLPVDVGSGDDTKLICFSGAGFDDKLREAAAQDEDVVLIGLEELYAR